MRERLPEVGQAGTADLSILLTDTNRCPVVARLVMRFQKLGARVAVLCTPPGHPVQSLRERVQIFAYSGLQPVASLRTAIETFRPDVIVSACDRSVQHLHELHAICRAEGGAALEISSLIQRSLGSPQSFSVVSSRHALLQFAIEEGIRVPMLNAIVEVSDLERMSAEIPLPWVMKADGTWGGRGVRIVHSVAEAEKRFYELTENPGTFELIKRMSFNRDRDWIYSEWNRPRPGVIAQSFIPGRPANCAVVCHEGEVLAGIAVDVVQTQGATGPATIVQSVDGQEMIQAARLLARRLRLSGFFGLDFVIEQRTGAAWLIEMNPRCTPPCPLPLGDGHDLVAAFCAHLRQQPVPHTVSVTDKSWIAYFPGGQSGADGVLNSLLLGSYLDIPSEEPALVQDMLNPRPIRSLFGQAIDWLRLRLLREKPPNPVLVEGAMAAQPVVAGDLDGHA